ncbi:undecaprenyl-diphosphate phosphatase [Portibacter lacus]|uniref:Undecaprenyl-diphosphatase n=1 Tax=Portibacter lacus TaxID=1099794 RepID=A0AA37ST70_9BACT|nr:undecaprenyl-diphosphate phosphatase [Portibacter lacus]GLR20063.1 undecaprenyl-diphosphatase [Portibacter lacus]
MDLIKAAILGIVQGLTEFLPVSSSGHLELFKYFMNDDAVGEESMMMTVVLHFATALSTIFVFRKTILELIKGLFKFEWNKETKFIAFVVVSMIPAVFVGLFLEEEMESLFNKNIPLVAIMLFITGLILFIADRAEKTDKELSFIHSIIIGIAQAIAILPGISRSGATISTSVLLGLDREVAARFSFIMVLPLIFGKIAKDLLDGSFTENASNVGELSVGFIAAFITGLFACTLMIRIVKNSKLSYFSYYCFAIAAISLIFYYVS